MATLLKVLNNLADIKSAGGVALRVRTQDARKSHRSDAFPIPAPRYGRYPRICAIKAHRVDGEEPGCDPTGAQEFGSSRGLWQAGQYHAQARRPDVGSALRLPGNAYGLCAHPS